MSENRDELSDALRSLQERFHVGGAALLANLKPAPDTREMLFNPVHPSRAPARPYRIRVDTGPIGYLWLEWLGACARTAGVAQTSAP